MIDHQSPYNVGDSGSIPASGRPPGEGNGHPLQYSCLRNPMDRGAWWPQSMGLLRSPCSSNCKESACDAGDQGSVPGLGSSSGEGNGNPLQYSCMENPIDRESHRQFVGSQRVEHGWVTNTHKWGRAKFFNAGIEENILRAHLSYAFQKSCCRPTPENVCWGCIRRIPVACLQEEN